MFASIEKMRKLGKDKKRHPDESGLCLYIRLEMFIVEIARPAKLWNLLFLELGTHV